MPRSFSHYLGKHALFKDFIGMPPEQGLGMAVVIPCYNEPAPELTLQSLRECTLPDTAVEVIVVINSAKKAPKAILDQNRLTYHKLQDWATKNTCPGLQFHILNCEGLPDKHAGAGMARKIGMDEALRRFARIGAEDGILVSLDADTTVSQTYLNELEHTFADPKARVAILRFEHPLERDGHPPEIHRAITQYELYLRYYVHAMHLSGFPYAHHTIGSAFALRARVYASSGGMNRRQGGEDFYFLHKLFPEGGVKHIHKAAVYPSPRPSERVPFGTGPEVRRLAKTPGTDLATYDFDAFMEIGKLFQLTGIFFMHSPEEAKAEQILHRGLYSYLKEAGLSPAIEEIRANCASPESFRKRFLRWFNAFRYLKCLNYLHKGYFTQKPLALAAAKALQKEGVKTNGYNARQLLESYRKIEYGGGND